MSHLCKITQEPVHNWITSLDSGTFERAGKYNATGYFSGSSGLVPVLNLKFRAFASHITYLWVKEGQKSPNDSHFFKDVYNFVLSPLVLMCSAYSFLLSLLKSENVQEQVADSKKSWRRTKASGSCVT